MGKLCLLMQIRRPKFTLSVVNEKGLN